MGAGTTQRAAQLKATWRLPQTQLCFMDRAYRRVVDLKTERGTVLASPDAVLRDFFIDGKVHPKSIFSVVIPARISCLPSHISPAYLFSIPVTDDEWAHHRDFRAVTHAGESHSTPLSLSLACVQSLAGAVCGNV
jgi:hypothetical protein